MMEIKRVKKSAATESYDETKISRKRISSMPFVRACEGLSAAF
jgi:hypothetical protein